MMHLNQDAPFWGIPGAPQPLNEETDWGEEHCDSKGSIIWIVSRVIMSYWRNKNKTNKTKRKRKKISL